MAVYESKNESHVAKLSDSNYRIWKTEMKWYLRSKGLLEYALGTVTVSADATEGEKKIFRVNDDKAIATIGLHIEPNQQIHIEECENAHEAWLCLERVHQSINRIRIMQLKREFCHAKMKDSETMSSYIARIKTAATNLKQAGAEVKDEDLAYTILAGLPNTYENLNMTLASLPDDKFTSAEIIRVLIAEYDRRQSRIDDDPDKSPEALLTSKEREVTKHGKASSTHTATKRTTCFNCKKPGHYARDCRLKSGNQPNQRNDKRNDKSKRNLDAFLISLNNLDIEDTWLLDSGCTHHVCRQRNWFQNFRELEGETVNTAANTEQKYSQLHAKGVGDIVLKTYVGNKQEAVVLRNVYYVPHLRKNLMSVSQIEKKGKEMIVKDGKIKIRNISTKRIMCEAFRKNDLYVVRAEVDMTTEAPIEANLFTSSNDVWHRRFCHINSRTIERLAKDNKVRGLDDAKTEKYDCKACRIGKSIKSPCKRIEERQSNDVCELIYSDLCGPMPIKSISGNKYFITFVDVFSRKTTVMCIKSKDEVTDCVKKYIARVEREKGKKVKRFRSDNGLEYCNRLLTEFFNATGIKHERSNVETPQMNGIAERINRTLMDLVRSMLKDAKLPKMFWAEAVTAAAYIRDRVGHSSIKGDVPLAIWTGRTPSVQHLKVYGCTAYANLPKQNRRKLDNRAVECILVGYASQTRGYRLWCPEKSDVIITKHVRFAEDKIGYEWLYKDSVVHHYKLNQSWLESDSETESDSTATHQSNKSKAKKSTLHKPRKTNWNTRLTQLEDSPDHVGKWGQLKVYNSKKTLLHQKG